MTATLLDAHDASLTTAIDAHVTAILPPHHYRSTGSDCLATKALTRWVWTTPAGEWHLWLTYDDGTHSWRLILSGSTEARLPATTEAVEALKVLLGAVGALDT